MRLFILVLIFNNAFAQSYDRHYSLKIPENTHFYVIPPDSSWSQMPWRDSVYIFTEFDEGRIEFKNGYSPTSPLEINYNIFFENFMIRHKDGSIVPFNDNNDYKNIWVSDHKFIYQKGIGYLQIILDGRAAVAESTYMDVIIAYPSLDKYPTPVTDARTRVDKTKRYFYVQKKYYIVNTSNGKIYRVGKNVLPKIFRKEKETIRNFEKENKIDYTKKDDLIKIALFCNREL